MRCIIALLNSEFSLESRQFGGVDRRPTGTEYEALVNLAKQTKNPEMASIIILTRELGLQVHEAVRLNHIDVEKVLERAF